MPGYRTGLVGFIVGICCAASASGAGDAPDRSKGSYVVVVSQPTLAAAEWKPVVQVLREKHDADVVVWTKSVWDARAELARIMPRYACFVARPEECGREFVVNIHRMTRKLDDDPYTDVIWGIVTGYDPADALRIARETEPLIVRRALSGCGAVDLNDFDEGIKFDEGQMGERYVKKPGGKQVREKWSPDSTKGLVDGFNEFKPDAFYTSGHASEHDWRIGYNYQDGYFRCKDGQLYGADTKEKRFDVKSPNRKVYLAMGNCLIGNILKRDCMALAYMHSAGVDQMVGYTAVTFFGYVGWGVNEYFEHNAGRYTLAESFYAINQSLVHDLETDHSRIARVDLPSYEERDGDRFEKQLQLKGESEIGMLWDRDVVAFYGDPAWEVRRPVGQRAWDDKLEEKDGLYTLTVTAMQDGSWGKRPIVIFLPHRLEDIHVTEGDEYFPIVTDNFVLLPTGRTHKKGETVSLQFRAKNAAEVRTSAKSAPIVTRVAMTPQAVREAAAKQVEDMAVEVPHSYRDGLATALAAAGENAAELEKAIVTADPSQREAVCFLIVNMPDVDLRRLKAAYLLDNVSWAFKARNEMAWGKDVPDEIFLNDVLPYASINERRDNWRKDFFEKFGPIVKNCRSPGEAAQKLNSEVYSLVNVHYHKTKRPKPDQSPYESMECHYASCTGLSVLLIDACRAVGVPARLAGTPQWSDNSGNHSWVEIWDRQWWFTGASEPAKEGLNHAWFEGAAAKANDADRLHRIYATSFKKTDLSFPLVWDIGLRYVSAYDVTPRYTDRKKVRVQVAGGAAARVMIRQNGLLCGIVESRGRDGRETVELPGGMEFEAEVATEGGKVTKAAFKTSEQGEQVVELKLVSGK